MVNNMNFFASIKVSNSNSSKKNTDFPGSSSKKTNGFRDSLNEAARNISKNDNSSIRREMANRSAVKLKEADKANSAADEDTGCKTEAKEKQMEKIKNKLEQLLLNLQELANLQQTGDVTAEAQSALTEGIKDAFQEVTAFQNKLTKIENTQLKNEIPELQTKIEKLETLMEGILNELKADGDLTENGNSTVFIQKLESVVEETLPRLETIANSLAEKIDAEAGNTEVINETTANSVSSEQNSSLETQVQEKTYNNITEVGETGETAESPDNETDNEAAVTENKTLMNKSDDKAETSENAVTEEEKNALNGKLEKVSVKNSGDRKQDRESETGKEASKEVRIAASTKQNKLINDDTAAVRLEHAVKENNPESIINQTEAPRTQTVSRTEIINQIVKKAEIILTDAQSEMRMQLEPENLGKLTLKIAVERGLITAKFSAESYEVKKVIESSLNELRDMLQEKGLEVQNFSVSVGQDNREFNNSNAFHQWKETVKLNGSSMNKGSYEGYLSTEPEAVKAVNPYNIHNGVFDHIA